MSFHSKAVLVVGASSGIGKATVRQLLDSDQCDVIGVDIKLSPVQSGRYQHILCDLSNTQEVTSLVDQLPFETIDSIIYCAAEQHLFSALKVDLEATRKMLDVNVLAAWVIVAAIQQRKIDRQDALTSVVLVSSVHAVATSSNIAGYAMTKAALSSLVRSLAIEFSPHKTRVNGIMPGAVMTHMFTDHFDISTKEAFIKKQLVDHIAQPDEIAKSILFLIGNDSTYMTGQNMIVDGGVLSQLATEVG